METRQVRVLGWLFLVLFFGVVLWGSGSLKAQEIPKVIDKTNYKEHRDLLIPAQLKALERGEWTFPTGKLDFAFKHWDRYLAASEKNAGKYDIDSKGNLVDKSTGKFPAYNVYGSPFPQIDPKDPKVAEKIIWNFNFQKYRVMGEEYLSTLYWVGKRGADERYVGGDQTYLYYQGRLPGQELKSPQGLLYQALSVIKWPMGTKGSNMLNWEFIDERENAFYAYIPAIRRARQMSAAARSDPTWGSDGWMDQQRMWSGKTTSMRWKFVGERTVLAGFTNTRKNILAEAPDGTITRIFSSAKFGYQTPGWKGAPWAPTSMTFVPRSVWIIDGYPLNPYYNFGKYTFYVDKDTYVIWMAEVFDKAGEYWNWYALCSNYGEAPSGNNTVGIVDNTIIIDDRIQHATVSDENQKAPGRIFVPKSKLGPGNFSVANMLEKTK